MPGSSLRKTFALLGVWLTTLFWVGRPVQGADYIGRPVVHDIAPPAGKPVSSAFVDPVALQPSLAGGHAPTIVGAPAVIYGSHPPISMPAGIPAPYPVHLSPAPGNFVIPPPVYPPVGLPTAAVSAYPVVSGPAPMAVSAPPPAYAKASSTAEDPGVIAVADPTTHPVLPSPGMAGAAPLMEAQPIPATAAPPPGGALVAQVIYVPPGASIPMYLDRPFSSGNSHVGDMAYARISNGSSFGIPQGTIAELVVLMVEPARWGFARPGKIQIGSNRLILPDGQSIYLKGLIVNALGSSDLKGASNNQRFASAVGKAALAAGVGAIAGVIAGAASGGAIGVSTWVGAVIGVVVGGVWAGVSKGKDVDLPSGLPVMLQVTEGAQVTF